MDKKKTGCLIKEARMKKNYTQNELGDLLGVTNKAVSRWENGDSFPDVGLLENLSEILDIRIQDIVTGEKTANDNSAVRDVVRLAKMQQMDKKLYSCMEEDERKKLAEYLERLLERLAEL